MRANTVGLLLLLTTAAALVAQSGKGIRKGGTGAISSEPPAHVESALRCELHIGAADRHRWLAADSLTHIHFVLFSNTDGLKIYQDWNSWGYYARSFVVKDVTRFSPDAKYTEYTIMQRRDKIWTRNFPSTNTLNKGEILITDVFLCDDSWIVSPKLPPKQTTLEVVGRFKQEAERTPGLWAGTIESKPINVVLEEGCLNHLNRAEFP